MAKAPNKNGGGGKAAMKGRVVSPDSPLAIPHSIPLEQVPKRQDKFCDALKVCGRLSKAARICDGRSDTLNVYLRLQAKSPRFAKRVEQALEVFTTEKLAKITEQGLELGGIDTRNKRRLIRLLETNGAEQKRQPLRKNTLILGLQTDRELLTERITARVDAMLAAGLEQEVDTLQTKYGWNCEALKGVGYSQWQPYFLGQKSAAELAVTQHRILKATLDLAKRQRTWFKRNKSIHWLSTPVNLTAAVDLATTFLSK